MSLLPALRLPAIRGSRLAAPMRLAALALWTAAALAAPVGAQDGPTLDQELDQALSLTPNLENGKRLYQDCFECHGETGWGSADGTFPQIAGQHRSVIIKQIVDIRFGQRENPDMLPFIQRDELGGPQALADIAGYVSSLPMNPNPGVGPGTDLVRGEMLFGRECAICHLNHGEGEGEILFPKITGQYYAYMLRQLDGMKEGRRRNALRGMVIRIKRMTAADLEAVADYVSRLKPVPPHPAPGR